MQAYRAADCASAIPLLSTVARADGRANLPLGQCYFETASYLKAIEPLRIYVGQFPADMRGPVLLARSYLQIGRNDDAIKAVTHFTEQHPQDLNARALLGRIYLETGDKERSISILNEVLKQAPQNPAALLGLSFNALERRHWQEAIDNANRVIQIAPGQPEAYRVLGDAYAHLGQYEKALGPYKEAFRRMPLDFAAEKGLAQCYAKLDQWDEVARVLGSGTIAEANDLQMTELAQRAFQDKPQALEEYCRAVIALNPVNTVAHRALAQSAYAAKQTDRAKTEYIEILKLEKDPDPQINFKLGQIFEAEGNIPEARHYYEAAGRSPRATSEMYIALARIYLAIADAPDAKIALAKVGTPESETKEFKIMNAEVALRTGDVKAASAAINDLLSQDPSNKKLLDLAADASAKQEKYAEAATFLERRLQADPEDKQVRYKLAMLYTDHQELKGEAKAMDLLKDSVTKQEPAPDGYLLLANLYRRNKDFANAKTYFDLGFAKVPNPVPARLAWAYTSYAMMYDTQGNLPEAVAQAVKATQVDPNDDMAQYSLALMYIKAKNAEGVDQIVSRLETRDPDRAAQLVEYARRYHLPLKSQVAQ